MPHKWLLTAALSIVIIARNSLTFLPVPGSAPGFISGPWYPVLYHATQSFLALNPASSWKMLFGSAAAK